MNKISEKAVWDELVPSEDEKTSSASFGQPTQSQMMLCYKCNQIIPANSAFCPWCQTELFVTCPKCGNKYSSQYPSCHQCGTNRDLYLQEERNKQLEIQKQKEEMRRRELDEHERQRKLMLYKKEKELQEELRQKEKRKLTIKYDILYFSTLIVLWLGAFSVVMIFLIRGIENGTVGIGLFFLCIIPCGLSFGLFQLILRPLEKKLDSIKSQIIQKHHLQ